MATSQKYLSTSKNMATLQNIYQLPKIVTLTPLTREAAIAAVKNVFRPPAFQLLYSASARVNTVKES